MKSFFNIRGYSTLKNTFNIFVKFIKGVIKLKIVMYNSRLIQLLKYMQHKSRYLNVMWNINFDIAFVVTQ